MLTQVLRAPRSEVRVPLGSSPDHEILEPRGTRPRGTRNSQRKRDSLVVVPTYNEADNLERLVAQVIKVGPFDILIVDDNSPDGTGGLADRLASDQPIRVSVLHRAEKLGLGSAYVAGFRHALAHNYQRVFEMDADFSHDPALLPLLRASLDKADVVLGSRYIAGGGTRHWPAWRRALSQFGSRYAGLVLGMPFHDLTGGFKGFRSRVLSALDLDAIQSNGYAFQIEVTYRSFKHGFHIVEAPIMFADRCAGRSKMRASIVTEALLVVWRLRFESSRHVLERRVPT
jgi:dolichol-phosphate mannosyltransferase